MHPKAQNSAMLTAEIKHQLNYDILSYSWLIGITARLFPALDFSERADLMIESIAILIEELNIEVGPTVDRGGRIHIENWGDTDGETISRLREEVAAHGDPTKDINLGFRFWIGLQPTANDSPK